LLRLDGSDHSSFCIKNLKYVKASYAALTLVVDKPLYEYDSRRADIIAGSLQKEA